MSDTNDQPDWWKAEAAFWSSDEGKRLRNAVTGGMDGTSSDDLFAFAKAELNQCIHALEPHTTRPDGAHASACAERARAALLVFERRLHAAVEPKCAHEPMLWNGPVKPCSQCGVMVPAPCTSSGTTGPEVKRCWKCDGMRVMPDGHGQAITCTYCSGGM